MEEGAAQTEGVGTCKQPGEKESELSLAALVQFEWQVAIGDQALTIEELTALAALKIPLINIRGQWIHVSQEDIKLALELLKKKANSKATVADVLKLRIGAMSALALLVMWRWWPRVG